MKNLLTKIFLGGLNNLCYGKEKLGADDGNYQATQNATKSQSSSRWAAVRTCGCKANEPQENYKQAENNGDVAQYFKEATGTVEFFEKITHNYLRFIIYKDRGFRGNESDNEICFTA